MTTPIGSPSARTGWRATTSGGCPSSSRVRTPGRICGWWVGFGDWVGGRPHQAGAQHESAPLPRQRACRAPALPACDPTHPCRALPPPVQGRQWRLQALCSSGAPNHPCTPPLPLLPPLPAGNDFSKLFAPLIRDGRMDKFYWQPTRPDLIGILHQVCCRIMFWVRVSGKGLGPHGHVLLAADAPGPSRHPAQGAPLSEFLGILGVGASIGSLARS